MKSIELLQNNNKNGLGFNRIPKDDKLKKEIVAKDKEINAKNKEIKDLELKIIDMNKTITEIKNTNQVNIRNNLTQKMNIDDIIKGDDSHIYKLINEYLVMKQHLINSNLSVTK
jgi:predicted RNase H-like nuclease (RuvC/YqgF family)